MFLRTRTTTSTEEFSQIDGNVQTERLKQALQKAETVIIGAGAGLSTSAGFTYSGERFEKWFGDFRQVHGFSDMYSGGFFPYKTLEEYWAYWSRYIYINRYMDAPLPVYQILYDLVKEKDYFVLTTNVDHCFQKAGFDRHRLYYMQGDYGLFQCSLPCHKKTYENKEVVKKMLQAQGFSFDARENLIVPQQQKICRKIPAELVPYCPVCKRPMTMNLRCDMTFVEDDGWRMAEKRYEDFWRRHEKVRTLFLELGTGYNTPGIIKYNFWHRTATWPDAVYACINKKEACAPEEIRKKSICVEADIGAVLEKLYDRKNSQGDVAVSEEIC